MAFNVRFYNFQKETNSTLQPEPLAPETTRVTYSCEARDPLSLAAPVIKVLIPMDADIDFNYMYVAAFNRYYWITDWEYRDRCWYVSGSVDALATYRNQIGDISAYILRSAHEYDGTIQDNFYPVKAQWNADLTAIGTPWQYGDRNSGCYSVGIISSGGVTNFWLMSRATLEEMMAYILSDDYAAEVLTTLGITAYPEAKAIIDPLQYIASVTWLPVALGDTLLTSIKIGYVVKPLNVSYANPSVPGSFTLSFEKPLHPLTSARGAYMNVSPYTRLSIFIPPFGIIDIDTSAAQTAAIIRAVIKVDMCLGNGVLELWAGSDIMLSRVCARVGVPVQLSQVIAPGYGLLSAAGAAAGIAGDIISGNFGGAASGLASGIGNAITGQIPSANTIGSVGSIDTLTGTPQLQALFGIPATDDLAHRGRPLCAVRTIRNVPGYLLCADVDIHIAGATSAEMDMIKAYMESGFYYA